MENRASNEFALSSGDQASLLYPQSSILDSSAAIHVTDLSKRYGETQAIRGISLDVARGEIFGLIGPDGAGKTTTFQILAGVMQPTSGEAEVFGRLPLEARSQTG